MTLAIYWGLTNPLGYVRAREAWLEQVNSYDKNVTVVLNAASFFLLNDSEQAEELLKKAQALKPDDTDITSKLAHLYQLSAMTSEVLGNPKSESREQNEMALTLFEQTLKQTKDGPGKPRLVIEIAKTAFKVGQLGKAKKFAERLLTEYSSDEDAVHAGNTTLGLLALKKDDIEAANKYLIESGKTKGSPVLSSFGPSMELASELLKKGQQKTVLEYFELCEKFWTFPAGKKKLEAWKKAVEEGKTPDFKRQVDVTVFPKPTDEPKTIVKAKQKPPKKMPFDDTSQRMWTHINSSLADSILNLDGENGFDRHFKNEIKELQVKVAANPNDVQSRIRLLGFYSNERVRTAKDLNNNESGHDVQQKLATWFIKNYPASTIAGDRACRIKRSENPLGYTSGKEIWLEQIDTYDENVAVLTNAAAFLLRDDRQKAEELLNKAQTLEPWSAEIAEEFAFQYKSLAMHSSSYREKLELYGKAMAQFDRALSQTDDEAERPRLIVHAAAMAFKTGQVDRTKKLADRLLKQYSDDGEAVHYGNLLLGLMALKQGNIEAANKYLIESGKTTGSPRLDSRGPNMTLAKALLEKGQQETVLEFLELCKKFWKGKQLRELKAAVKAGDTPNFGTNLWRAIPRPEGQGS